MKSQLGVYRWEERRKQRKLTSCDLVETLRQPSSEVPDDPISFSELALEGSDVLLSPLSEPPRTNLVPR